MDTSAVPSTYMPRELKIPDGFDVVLKDLTREILREQPPSEDIYRFCAEYFATKSAGAAEDDNPAAALARMSPEEIEDLIVELFRENDKDNSGELDRSEFKGVFNQLQETLGLHKREVDRILAEADANQNGSIEYHEFVPVATSIIQSIVAKFHLREQEKMEEKAYADAEYEWYHNMPRDQIESILTKLFNKADKDKSGTLDKKEFEDCLKNTELGLTRREINLLMMEADRDNNDSIDYDEFRPLCMKVLVELSVQDWINEHIPRDDEELAAFLSDLFRSADVDSLGTLTVPHLQSLLMGADLGLTRIQVCSILSEASVEDDGSVMYEDFVPKASSMVSILLSMKGASRPPDSRWDQADVEGRLMSAHPNAVQFSETFEPDEFNLRDIEGMIESALPELEPRVVTQLARIAFPVEGGKDALYSYITVVDQAYWALVEWDSYNLDE